MIRVLWFAWARERIGCAEEAVPLPGDAGTLGRFLEQLRRRSEAHDAVLSEPEKLRFAVNLAMAEADCPLNEGDELAIFPPVTGG